MSGLGFSGSGCGLVFPPHQQVVYVTVSFIICDDFPVLLFVYRLNTCL